MVTNYLKELSRKFLSHDRTADNHIESRSIAHKNDKLNFSIIYKISLQSSSRKSALLSAAKKAKLKNQPSRVRFAESVDINGSPLYNVSTYINMLLEVQLPYKTSSRLLCWSVVFLVCPSDGWLVGLSYFPKSSMLLSEYLFVELS